MTDPFANPDSRLPAAADGGEPTGTDGRRPEVDGIRKPPLVDTESTLGAAALAYAAAGYRVLPLHSVVDGRCSCRESRCTSLGKHPRTGRGVLDATTASDVISDWWRRWPDANIGVACGGVPPLVVIDIDPRNGGSTETWARYVGETEAATFGYDTGGGGVHLWYQTEGKVVNRTQMLPGVDVKGHGGYVVVPPSVHVSGNRYRHRPESLPIRSLRSGLITASPRPAPGDGTTVSRRPADSIFGGAREGERDELFHRYACSLRARKVTLDEARALVAAAWREAEQGNHPFPLEVALEKVNRVYREFDAGTVQDHLASCGEDLLDGVSTLGDLHRVIDDDETAASVAAVFMKRRSKWVECRDRLRDTGVRSKDLDDAESRVKAKTTALRRRLADADSEPSDPEVPEFNVDDPNVAELSRRAWEAVLARSGSQIFLTGTVPVRVVRDAEGHLKAQDLTEDRLLHELQRAARWYRATGDGPRRARPGRDIAKDMLAFANPPAPPLTRIVGAPVFSSEGEILTEPGYHAASRTLFEPAEGLEVPPIMPSPNAEHLATARAWLCDELLVDFPFTSDAERAHSIALLLLPFARELIDGPTPLHLIEKPTPGTGGGLLTEAVTFVALGTAPSMTTIPRSSDELRKRVTATLREGSSFIILDNVRELGGDVLPAALTARTWEDRILGVSAVGRFPVRATWIATGNNPRLSREMTRRIVRIRLDAAVPKPEQRSTFRHDPLMTWARANRGGLIWAALTLIQGWIAYGQPRSTERRLGAFEDWSGVMGGILAVGGIPGFLGNQEDVYAFVDDESGAEIAFIEAWSTRYGGVRVRPKDLLAVAVDTGIPGIDAGFDLVAGTTKLGIWLKERRDRVYQVGEREVRVRCEPGRGNGNDWWLEG